MESVASPFALEGDLSAVTAVSATDVWAVGSFLDGRGHQALIEHWNGNRWSRVRSPATGTGTVLHAVTAASADDVWAVGRLSQLRHHRSYADRALGRRSLECGAEPRRGPAEQPPGRSGSVFSTDVWAVGDFLNAGGVLQAARTGTARPGASSPARAAPVPRKASRR